MCSRVANDILVSVCVVVVLTSSLRCPEVGLDLSLLGVQRLEHTLSLLSLWLRVRSDSHCGVACASGVLECVFVLALQCVWCCIFKHRIASSARL